jgi:integrase/recombinase XerD
VYRSPHTHRAYQQDIQDFQAFAGLRWPEAFRDMTRTHVIDWRQQLTRQGLANDTIRRKLADLSPLYAYLCDCHAVLHNPMLGGEAAALDEPRRGDAGARRPSGAHSPTFKVRC